MAIWKHDGHRWLKANFEQDDLGTDLYLCCPGPSLASVDPADLRQPGVSVMAVNRAYPHIPRPEFWVGMDRPACFNPTLLHEPCAKFLRGTWRESKVNGRLLRECPRTYFADIDDRAHPVQMFDLHGPDVRLTAPLRNSFTAALHLTALMGAKRIHLLGCDFGGPTDYHDGDRLTESQRAGNRKLYRDQVRWLRHVALEAAYHNVELLSCTPESPVNDFLTYLPLEQALKASHDRLPLSWSPEPNARDEALCHWPAKWGAGFKSIGALRGVVVGVTQQQAWMLNWFWGHYRRQNTLPVAFALFGELDDEWRSWCAQRGSVFRVRAPECVAGWFRKPFALLQSPIKQFLWLDLDCEVRGPLEPLLDSVHDGVIRAGANGQPGQWQHTQLVQPHEGLPSDGTPLCTGLLAVERGHPIIEQWALNSIPPTEFRYTGDNEILAVVVHRSQADLIPWQPGHYCPPWHPAASTATIVHHCGKPAKLALARSLGIAAPLL